MPWGKIKWFDAKKGYGFITSEENQKDIFLHVSDICWYKNEVLKESWLGKVIPGIFENRMFLDFLTNKYTPRNI